MEWGCKVAFQVLIYPPTPQIHNRLAMNPCFNPVSRLFLELWAISRDFFRLLMHTPSAWFPACEGPGLIFPLSTISRIDDQSVPEPFSTLEAPISTPKIA